MVEVEEAMINQLLLLLLSFRLSKPFQRLFLAVDDVRHRHGQDEQRDDLKREQRHVLFSFSFLSVSILDCERDDQRRRQNHFSLFCSSPFVPKWPHARAWLAPCAVWERAAAALRAYGPPRLPQQRRARRLARPFGLAAAALRRRRRRRRWRHRRRLPLPSSPRSLPRRARSLRQRHRP